MSDSPETAEDAAAGILNGVMLCLLGGAFPALFLWFLVREWDQWRFEPSLDFVSDAGSVAGLSVLSFFGVRSGIRLIKTSVRYFRKHSPTASG